MIPIRCYRLFVVLPVLMGLLGCTSAGRPPAIDDTPPSAAYVEKMKRIDKDAVATSFSSKDFCEIFANPRPYIADTLRYLAQPGPSENMKLLAGEGMNSLEQDDLIAFGNKVMIMFKRGEISEKILWRAALPPSTLILHFTRTTWTTGSGATCWRSDPSRTCPTTCKVSSRTSSAARFARKSATCARPA